MTPDPPPRTVPSPDGLNADFYRQALERGLCFQRCSACARFRHPPRYLCAVCGGRAYEWTAASGKGTLFSWTVTHRPVDPGWANELPYATVVVEMEEGVRLVGALRDLSLDRLALGVPLIAELEPENDEFAFIYFRPI